MKKRIRVVVESIAGECAAGCRTGDVFYYDDGAITLENTDTVLCSFALPSLIPYLAAACRETDDDDWINLVHRVQCPDMANRLVFRLKRLD